MMTALRQAQKQNWELSPVNCTFFLGKQIKNIIKDRISQQMDKYKLKGSKLHNINKGKSCSPNLLKCFEKVNKIVDKVDL